MSENPEGISIKYDPFMFKLWPVAFKEYLLKIIDSNERQCFERIRRDWKYVPAQYRNRFCSSKDFVDGEISKLKKNVKRAREFVNEERIALQEMFDPPKKGEMLFEFLTQLHYRRIESHTTRRQDVDSKNYLRRVKHHLTTQKQLCKENHASVVTKKHDWTAEKMELARRMVVECGISIEKLPLALLAAGNWRMNDREPSASAIPSVSTVKNWLDTLSMTDRTRITRKLKDQRYLHLMADGSKGADNLEVCDVL